MSETRIEFDCCFPLTLADGFRFKPHRHDGFHEMILTIRGGITSRHASTRTSASVGECLFDPEGSAHGHQCAKGLSTEIIVARWSGSTGPLPARGPLAVRDRDQRLCHQMRWMLELHPSDDPADRRALQALAVTLCHEFVRLLDPAPQAFVDRIRRYIREHLDEPIRLDDLAREAAMSKYHFARQFKQRTGRTPLQMVHQLRLEAARALLLDEGLTLDAVARRVGLVDASHLSRLFRRVTGQSPGQYRRAALGR